MLIKEGRISGGILGSSYFDILIICMLLLLLDLPSFLLALLSDRDRGEPHLLHRSHRRPVQTVESSVGNVTTFLPGHSPLLPLLPTTLSFLPLRGFLFSHFVLFCLLCPDQITAPYLHVGGVMLVTALAWPIALHFFRMNSRGEARREGCRAVTVCRCSHLSHQTLL